MRNLLHLRVGELAAHIAHLLMRPLAGAKRLDLVEEIELLLPREMRNVGAFGDPVRAMAGRALGDDVGKAKLFLRDGGKAACGRREGRNGKAKNRHAGAPLLARFGMKRAIRTSSAGVIPAPGVHTRVILV